MCYAETSFTDDAPTHKFLFSKEIILDSSMEANSIAKACSLASKQFKIFKSKAVYSCRSKDIAYIFKRFARQIPNNNSDIIDPEKRQREAKKHLQERSCAVESLQKDLWRAPQDLSAVQTFSLHIISNCQSF